MISKLKEVNLGYKYRIYPTAKQKELINYYGFIYNQTYNICYNIWKKEQEYNKDKDKQDKIFRSKTKYDKIVKRILRFRKLEFKTVVTQQARMNFFDAITHAFSKEVKIERAKAIAEAVTPKEKAKALQFGFPKYKKSTDIQKSFTWNNQATSIIPHKRNNYRYLKLVGNHFKLRYHRELPEDYKLNSLVISIDSSGKYFASFNIKFNKLSQQLTNNKQELLRKSVGIDMNVNNFSYSSLDISKLIDNQSKSRRNIKASKRFKIKERKQSRRVLVSKKSKTKISKNHKRNQIRMNKIHSKLKNQQNDLYHKLSKLLTNQFEMIVIEDLKTKNMSKSSKGNSVVPGKKVRQKSGLNRSILSASFFEFTRQLTYKQTLLNDKLLIKVNPHYTSQLCSKCAINGIEFKDKDNRKTQSKFKCINCGFTTNADLNASNNILFRGLTGYGYKFEDFNKIIGTGNVLALNKAKPFAIEH